MNGDPAITKPDITPEENTAGLPAAGEKRLPRFLRTLLHGEHSYLFWAFFLPFAIMVLIYIAMEVYPFGTSSVLVLDLNGQYIGFFEALRDWVYGEGSLTYSFGRALGGEFLGIYAYYLASPLSYIVALFPKHSILEALFLMLTLKCGLSGLTFGFYLHKTRRGSKSAVIMFSLMYALSAYAVVQQHNTMWIDNLILLPLIAIGIEELIKNRRYKLFTLSLALALLSNFYIGYMTCIFVLAYFFYYYFAHTAKDGNPLGEKYHFWRALLRTGVFSAIAIGISCVVLLPALYSLTFGKTTFSNPNFSPYQRFDFLDLISKLFPGSYDTVRPEGLPFVYCGTLALILLPFYFLSKKITVREKIASGIFLLFFVVSFNINTLDMIWHGFQRPNWLNYRYSFMFCFFVLVLAYKAFSDIRSIEPRSVLAVGSVLCIILFIIQKFDYENMPDFGGIWLSLACVIVLTLAVVMLIRTKAFENTAMIVTVLVCLELFCAGLLNLISLDKDVVISNYASYHTYIDEIQPIIDEIKADDDSFYRMETTEHKKIVDPLCLGFRGFTNSTSTLNSETITFLARMGLSSRSHWSKYLGGTPVFDSLMGLKYLVAKQGEEITSLYTLKTEDELYAAYENPYALPIAYTVSSDVKGVYFSDPGDNTYYDEENDTYVSRYTEYNSPLERMNALVTAMLGSDEKIELFVPVKIADTAYDNINMSYTTGHRKYSPLNSNSAASIIWTLDAVGSNQIFCYFPSDYTREVTLKLNGASYGDYFANESYRIVSLGSFSDGDDVKLTMTLKGDDLYLMSGESYFYYLDEELFAEIMPRLAECGFSIESYTEDHFVGTITGTAERRTVFTSIPYDKGWIVKVDGVAVETYEILDALIAFDIEPGEHTLELTYRPDALVYGIVITAVSSLLLLLIMIFGPALRRRISLLCSKNTENGTDIPAIHADMIIGDDEITGKPDGGKTDNGDG